LKTAYGKKFNEGLYTPQEENIIKEDELPKEFKGLGLKVYDAETDFKMIITSVGAYAKKGSVENFKKDWNMPYIVSQHICTAYIRNDMLGVPPIPHFCYGFSQMKEDSLVLSGNRDIASGIAKKTSESIAARDEYVVYYTPDKQINKTPLMKTENIPNTYNEMDWRRFQNGEKKQPDYIVAFKWKNVIPNKEEIIKAYQDWEGQIPIVLVDIDKCLETEKAKVIEMLKKYEESKNVELAREIIQKVKNNRVFNTEIMGIWMENKDFCSEFKEQLKQLEKDVEIQERYQEELRQNYDGVSAEERKNAVSEFKAVLSSMREQYSKEKQETKE
jgi:glycosyltransferase involved in cell wall biosynthesis